MKKAIVIVSILLVVLPIIYFGFGFHESARSYYDGNDLHVNPHLYIFLYITLVLGVFTPLVGLQMRKVEKERKKEKRALKKKRKKKEKLALYAAKLEMREAKLESFKNKTKP